jgi:hypothetical protein
VSEHPWDVLGVGPEATPDDIARAYREAAKRHHPDRAGDDGERMKEINAAYAALLARENPNRIFTSTGRPQKGSAEAPEPAPKHPGHWLAPEVRRVLGPELLAFLAIDEPVKAVADASTWDAHVVRLVATDRRLIWLRDDVPVDRVRQLPFRLLADVQTRTRGRRRPSGELRLTRVDRRRPLVFAEMDLRQLEQLAAQLPS